MNADDIIKFCDNLKKSMLEYHARGDDVSIGVSGDMEPASDEYGQVQDFIYMGTVLTIGFGRPANAIREKMEVMAAP